MVQEWVSDGDTCKKMATQVKQLHFAIKKKRTVTQLIVICFKRQ